MLEDRPEDHGGDEENEDGGDTLGIEIGLGGEPGDGGNGDEQKERAQPLEVGAVGEHGEEHDGKRAGEDERDHAPGSCRNGRCAPDVGEALSLHNVGDEAERHADAGRAEPPVPAQGGIEAPRRKPPFEGHALGEKAGDERRDEAADVDAHVEDGEPGVAALVAFGVEGADHGADVRLEEPGAERHQREAGVETGGGRNGEREMAEGDDGAAGENGAVGAEIAVGNEAARDRQHVYGHRVVAVDARGVERGKAQSAGRHRRDDEQREQRAHAVIGEALPQLGEEQRREPARMAAECRAVCGAQALGAVGRMGSRVGHRGPQLSRNGANNASEFYVAQTIAFCGGSSGKDSVMTRKAIAGLSELSVPGGRGGPASSSARGHAREEAPSPDI